MSNPPFKVGDKVVGTSRHGQGSLWLVKIDTLNSIYDLDDIERDFVGYKGTVVEIDRCDPSLPIFQYGIYSNCFDLDESQLFHDQLEALSSLQKEEVIK